MKKFAMKFLLALTLACVSVCCSSQSNSSAQSTTGGSKPKKGTLAQGNEKVDGASDTTAPDPNESVSDYCVRLWNKKDLSAQRVCSYACVLGEFPSGLKGNAPKFKEKSCSSPKQLGTNSLAPYGQECKDPDSADCKRFCAVHPDDIQCP